ncbi:hypothetical protein [Roseibium alexandrii]|uniref:Flagellar assembly protein FliH n=1 Tax=Roseibium alexandrii (strain DSM 17067 / NCIMB 14079 / DFL-11) TaxID=244592 RepID=A0A5E8GZS2_ROSAD|nr:hypothetical protein [Roseibium alexandrii]EEE44993.1 hypothetical protein SADFL11_2281 [Roseibium alexandrii DFL-11]
MTACPAAHIPVFSAPTFKSFDPEDALMVDVIMPDHRAEPVLSDEELRRAEYERGLSEGDERTRHHYEALLQQERERHASDLEEERIRFEMRESANVAAAIDGFLEITEKRLSYSVSKLLMPFLKQSTIDQLVKAFAKQLTQLAEVPGGTSIRMRGPETLVAQVLQQLPDLKDHIQVQHADQVELEAFFDETVIETRLGAWLGQLDALQLEETV